MPGLANDVGFASELGGAQYVYLRKLTKFQGLFLTAP